MQATGRRDGNGLGVLEQLSIELKFEVLRHYVNGGESLTSFAKICPAARRLAGAYSCSLTNTLLAAFQNTECAPNLSTQRTRLPQLDHEALISAFNFLTAATLTPAQSWSDVEKEVGNTAARRMEQEVAAAIKDMKIGGSRLPSFNWSGVGMHSLPPRISELQAIDCLRVSRNHLTSLAPLSGVRIQRLFIDGNQITSLEGLGAQPLMTLINAEQNLLTSVSLEHFPRLETASFSGNKNLLFLDESNGGETAFLDLPYLQTLSISQTAMTIETLPRFSRLELLVARETGIHEIPRGRLPTSADVWGTAELASPASGSDYESSDEY